MLQKFKKNITRNKDIHFSPFPFCFITGHLAGIGCWLYVRGEANDSRHPRDVSQLRVEKLFIYFQMLFQDFN